MSRTRLYHNCVVGALFIVVVCLSFFHKALLCFVINILPYKRQKSILFAVHFATFFGKHCKISAKATLLSQLFACASGARLIAHLEDRFFAKTNCCKFTGKLLSQHLEYLL